MLVRIFKKVLLFETELKLTKRLFYTPKNGSVKQLSGKDINCWQQV